MPVIYSTKGTPIKIDSIDFDRCSAISWRETRKADNLLYFGGYIPELGRDEFIHRYILGTPKGIKTDHRNGDTSDNTRDNLRFATHQQNMQNSRMKKNNTSGYKGVQLKPSGNYSARIRNATGKRLYLGTFPTAIEASVCYKQAAEIYHKEFARA